MDQQTEEILRQNFKNINDLVNEGVPFVPLSDAKEAFELWINYSEARRIKEGRPKVINMGTGSYLPQNRKDELNRI